MKWYDSSVFKSPKSNWAVSGVSQDLGLTVLDILPYKETEK